MEPEQLSTRRRSAGAALVVGPAAVGLGLVAHLVSGGAPPPGPVLVALTAVTSLFAAAAARAQLPAWAIAVGNGVLQQALHLLFTALAGPNAPFFPTAGHVHSHGGAVLPAAPGAAPLAVDFHLLVVAHLAAALLTTWLAVAAQRVAARSVPPRTDDAGPSAPRTARHPRRHPGAGRPVRAVRQVSPELPG